MGGVVAISWKAAVGGGREGGEGVGFLGVGEEEGVGGSGPVV